MTARALLLLFVLAGAGCGEALARVSSTNGSVSIEGTVSSAQEVARAQFHVGAQLFDAPWGSDAEISHRARTYTRVAFHVPGTPASGTGNVLWKICDEPEGAGNCCTGTFACGDLTDTHVGHAVALAGSCAFSVAEQGYVYADTGCSGDQPAVLSGAFVGTFP